MSPWLSACALAGLLASPAAHADGWGGAVGVASDRVTRGVSLSAGHATVMLDLDYRTDTGWTAGLGVARLQRTDSGAYAELTVSLSRDWQLDSEWTSQLGVVHYDYRGDDRAGAAYDELTAGLGWRGRLFGSVAVSPNTHSYVTGAQRRGRAVTWELAAQQPLWRRLSADAGIGYQDLHDVVGRGYRYASVGLNWSAEPIQLYLSYIDSRAAAEGVTTAETAGGRWVASMLVGF